MAKYLYPWTTLSATVTAGENLQAGPLCQTPLYRRLRARMHTRHMHSYGEYLQVLSSSSGEFRALSRALQETLRPLQWAPLNHLARLRGESLRRLLDALPVPALVLEGIVPGNSLRCLARNALAHGLFGPPSASPRWFFADHTPCHDSELPQARVLWHGPALRGCWLLLEDGTGHIQPVMVAAQRLPGCRPPRALVVFCTPSIRGRYQGGALPLVGGAWVVGGYHERLFEESVVAQLVTDRSGEILQANERARILFQAHERDLVGESLAAFLDGASLSAMQEILTGVAATGHGMAHLALSAQPDKVVEACAGTLHTEEGPRVHWVLYDVTSYVATERLRHDLSDLLLHDLRSPLATSLLGLEAASRNLDRGEVGKVRSSLATTGMALRRLGRLVDSLLDISRLEAGQPILRLAQVQLREILQVACYEVEPALHAHNLRLETSLPADLPAVVADGDMILRAVINLLDNAVKFSPNGGCIWLKATAQDQGVLLGITDEGPGIPPELQPRIFDKFVGLHLPHAPRGYGLGLAFCKLAAQAHSGWIAVDSVPGRGSTFALWLPCRPVFAGTDQAYTSTPL